MNMPKFRKLMGAAGIVGTMLVSGSALAQLTVSLSDEEGPADGVFEVSLNFQGDGNSDAFEGNILWDGTNVTSVDVSGCASGSNGALALSCQDISAGNDGNLRIQLAAGVNPLSDYTGTLVFELDGSLAVGDMIAIVWDEDSLFGGSSVTGEEVEINSTDGSITIGDVGPPDCVLALAPNSHDFGNVDVGSSDTHTFTLTNNGTTACTGLDAEVGPTPPFDGVGTDCDFMGGALAAGESCDIEVSFSPTAEGNFTGELDVIADGDIAVSAALSGNSGEIVIPPAIGVPTLQAWGLALMALLMLTIGVFSVRTFRS